MPTISLDELPPIETLIKQFGEDAAKSICVEYYRDPSHLEEFAQLFPDYVPTKLGEFHSELYDMYEAAGNVAAAAPRGFSKSTTTDTIYLAHRLIYARSRFVLLISDTFDQAKMLLDGLKSEFEANDILYWIYGDIQGDEWSSENLIVDGYGEDGEIMPCKVLPKGAGQKVRGLRFKQFRPDLIILDDLENDELVNSPDRRQKLENWFKRSLMPAMAKDIGKVIYIGTTLHREALLNKILEGRDGFGGFNTKRFKAIQDDGTSLWPERFSVNYLIGMRDDPKHPMYLGPISFSQEMMNMPISEVDQIIKPEWIHYFHFQKDVMAYRERHPDVPANKAVEYYLRDTYSQIIGHIDPAISEKATADYWAMVTVGIMKGTGKIRVLDVVRMRESDPIKQVEMILDRFAEWRHDKIQVEAVAYQMGLYSLVNREGAKRGLYPPVKAWRPDRDKRRRAIMASANFAGGLVELRQDHPNMQLFVEEVLSFPQGEHDDMFDAYLGAAESTVMKTTRRVFAEKPNMFK